MKRRTQRAAALDHLRYKRQRGRSPSPEFTLSEDDEPEPKEDRPIESVSCTDEEEEGKPVESEPDAVQDLAPLPRPEEKSDAPHSSLHAWFEQRIENIVATVRLNYYDRVITIALLERFCKGELDDITSRNIVPALTMGGQFRPKLNVLAKNQAITVEKSGDEEGICSGCDCPRHLTYYVEGVGPMGRFCASKLRAVVAFWADMQLMLTAIDEMTGADFRRDILKHMRRLERDLGFMEDAVFGCKDLV